MKKASYRGKSVNYMLVIIGVILSIVLTLLAIAEATQKIVHEKQKVKLAKAHERVLAISIGTGTGKHQHIFNARMAAGWGLVSWLYRNGDCPLLTSFSEAGCDLVDYHCDVAFQAFDSQHNYLRIQDKLDAATNLMDLSSEENLKALEGVGKALLGKLVNKNFRTGGFIPEKEQGTYAEALNKFANRLSEERKLRELNFQGAQLN